ncbi:MAG: hypothetical protein HY706_14360 [Candidatus Hydrogenedentes bacterium]|nr:hypothetical protein [Candidatus Hydrogenedentota bacterium]
MTKTRFIVSVVSVGAIFYFLILPICWLWFEPTVEAPLPVSAPYNQDLSFPVTVSLWHSNYEIGHVRFYVEHYESTAHGPKGLFYPEIVYTGQVRQAWSRWSINRLTRPHSTKLDVTVPFSRFAEEGLVGPGILKGKVDVAISYVYAMRRSYGLQGQIPTLTTIAVPFEMELTDSHQ